MASYVEDDGVTVNLVTVGSGTPAKRLPEIYPSRAEAAAGANAHLVAGDVSRDFVEITTGFTPRAQVLQPLTIVNAGPTIPIGFPPVRLEFPILSLNSGLRQRCVAPDVWPTLSRA